MDDWRPAGRDAWIILLAKAITIAVLVWLIVIGLTTTDGLA